MGDNKPIRGELRFNVRGINQVTPTTDEKLHPLIIGFRNKMRKAVDEWRKDHREFDEFGKYLRDGWSNE
jgi:hypothetical protein